MTTQAPTAPPQHGLVTAGTTIAALLAVTVVVLRWVGAQPPMRIGDLAGSLALAGLLLGPAWLAMRAAHTGQRAPLLGAAALLLVAAVPLFTLAVVGLVVVLLWLVAAARGPDPVGRAPGYAWRLVGAVLLAVGAVAALFVHLDPACWEQVRTEAGTTVRPVAPTDRAGFVWQVSSRSFSGSSAGAAGSGVLASGCTGDRIVPAEAAVSLLLTVGAVALARAPLAGRR